MTEDGYLRLKNAYARDWWGKMHYTSTWCFEVNGSKIVAVVEKIKEDEKPANGLGLVKRMIEAGWDGFVDKAGKKVAVRLETNGVNPFPVVDGEATVALRKPKCVVLTFKFKMVDETKMKEMVRVKAQGEEWVIKRKTTTPKAEIARVRAIFSECGVTAYRMSKK